MYDEIERLAANPETQKDALILWLALRLQIAQRTLASIAAATDAYERKISGHRKNRSTP